LWNVHRAFETPGRFLRQLAETPDGARYVILARDVSKSGGAWGTPTRRYAISLGCEVTHAPQLVYADGLDLDRDASFQPIGISCRICERAHCHQRAVPPLERRLTVNPDHRGTLPYDIAE
jgi:predicted transcriptional regulator